MEKENRLRLSYCPHCANALKVFADARKVICPHCNVPVRPGQTQTAPQVCEPDLSDNIRTAKAALSYFHFFFESFDWDAWLFTHRYTIDKTEQLVNRFLQTAGDEAQAWLLAFECLYIPALKKINGLSLATTSVATLYNQNQKKEAAAFYNSLRTAAAFLQEKSSEICKQLTFFTENAGHCGMDEKIIHAMQEKTQSLQNAIAAIELPRTADELPEIKKLLDQNNRAMADRFAEVGIDIELEYRKVGNYLAQKQIKDAVNTLQRIKGYKNSAALLKEVNRCYRFREVLQLAGRLYIDKGNSIHALENGKPAAEPLIRGIAQLLAVNADRILYVDTKNKLFRFDLTEKTTTEFDRKRSFPEITAYETQDTGAMYCTYRSKEGKGPKVFARILPETLEETILFEDTAIVYGIENDILVYTDSHGETFAANITDATRCSICRNRIELCAIKENHIIYTRNAPTADNKNMYIFTMGESENEQTLATNIFAVSHVAADAVYYTVGNKLSKCLYCTDFENKVTTQLFRFADGIELCDRHFIYASVGDAYNHALWRIDTQTNRKTLCTNNFAKICGLHCGRLFFTDTDSNLCSCLPDGSDKQILFADFRKMLLMQNDTLFFLAADEIQTTRDEEGNVRTREQISVYSIRADGTDLQKTAHAVADANLFNDKEIDFFKNAATPDGSSARWMFRYDTKSGETFKLLEYTVSGKKGK